MLEFSFCRDEVSEVIFWLNWASGLICVLGMPLLSSVVQRASFVSRANQCFLCICSVFRVISSWSSLVSITHLPRWVLKIPSIGPSLILFDRAFWAIRLSRCDFGVGFMRLTWMCFGRGLKGDCPFRQWTLKARDMRDAPHGSHSSFRCP